MPLTKLISACEYEKLIAQKEIFFLEIIIDTVKALQKGPDKKGLAFVAFASICNKESAYNNLDHADTWQLARYLLISEYIALISARENGIKDFNRDLPWKDLAELHRLISQKKYLPFSSVILEYFKLDLEQLEQRLYNILIKEKIKYGFCDPFLQTLYKDITFKTDTNNTVFGLPNIRKFTEFLLDIERLKKLQYQLTQLEHCDSSQPQGRAAILAVAQTVGELAKGITPITISLAGAIPFRQLNDLRNTIKNCCDHIHLAGYLRTVEQLDPDNLVEKLKQDLLILEPEIQFLLEMLRTHHQNIFNNFLKWDLLPSRSNSNFSTKVFNVNHRNTIENLIFIFEHALPSHERGTEITKAKIKILRDLLEQRLPFPATNEEQDILLKNIHCLLNIPNIAIAFTANVEPKERNRIKNWTGKFTQLLSYEIKKEVIKKEQEENLIQVEEFCRKLNHADPAIITITYTYEQAQLKNFLISLQTIVDLTQSFISQPHHNSSDIRKLCRNTPSYHLAVLYHFTVIGQCVRNLNGKPIFRRLASVTLRKEFEALRWIRNALMHDGDVTENGSLLDYFGNDFNRAPLSHNGGRGYDSAFYLQSLQPEIDKTIAAIGNYYRETSGLVELFFESTEDEFNEFFHYLLKQELKIFIEAKHWQTTPKTLTKFHENLIYEFLFTLGQPIEADSSLIQQAEEYLQIERFVTIEDLYKKQNEIRALAQKHQIKIEGLFGDIVKHGGHYDPQSSGMLVSANSLVQFAYFKNELNILLGKDFLCVTEDDLREITAQDNLETTISHIKQFGFDQVMQGFALYEAVQDRDEIRITELLSTPLCIDINVHGYTPLHSACYDFARGVHVKPSLPIVELLLLARANPYVFDKHERTCLHIAAAEGKLDLINLLLQHGVDPNQGNKHGTLPIELALQHGYTNIYKKLLPLTKVASQEQFIQAIKAQNIELIKKLLPEVNINLPNKDNEWPLHVAVDVGNLEIIFLLEQQSIDFFQCDEYQNNALHYACRTNNTNFEVIAYLIHKKVDVNGCNNSCQTPLHSAVFLDQPEIVTLLLKAGADPNAKTDSGYSPLMELIDSNAYYRNKNTTLKITQLILEAGYDFSAHSKYVGNSLHHAAEQGFIPAVLLMLDFGADPNAISLATFHDCRGKTAHEIALMKNRFTLAELLAEYKEKTISDLEMVFSAFGQASKVPGYYRATFFPLTQKENLNDASHLPTTSFRPR